MRSVLLLVLIICILSKKAFVSAVTVQSIFFVLSVTKSGMLSREHVLNAKSIAKGALLLFCGLFVSVLMTLYSSTAPLFHYLHLSFLTFGIYLLCCPLVFFMYKRASKISGTVVSVCALIPNLACLSAVNLSPFFTAMLIISGIVAVSVLALTAKKLS